MKIIVDNKIPYIQDAIQAISKDVTYLPAQDFTAENVRDADVLIIRTRVKCNQALLEGSNVKFIATATIGFDHIDTDYCASHGIEWRNAPGCNANSVRQYIESTLLLLNGNFFNSLKDVTIGVIGVGHVGSKVVEVAQQFGMNVLMNDPLRAQNEPCFQHTDLQVIQEQAQIITFHVPLTKEGLYPTYHLADLSFFEHLGQKPIIINTSRGGVVDNGTLLKALNNECIQQAVIDVWENEPHINLELLQHVFIGTPHIAGYSADGKAKASEMSLQSISDFFGLGLTIHIDPPAPLSYSIQADTYASALLQIYNPILDSTRLKENPLKFESLRGNYRVRREPSAFTIQLVK